MNAFLKRGPAAALAALLLFSCSRGYETVSGYAQGGVYSVCYNASGMRTGRAEAARRVDGILTEIDTVLSGYNRNSQLSRLNSGDTLMLSPLFREIYALSYRIFEKSGGAVDVAAGPLFDIWGFGFSDESMPSATVVDSVRSVCGMRWLKAPDSIAWNAPLCARDFLAAEAGTTAPRFNFNALAQGFSCDLVAEYLHSEGVRDMLVNIGEIYCEGLNPRGEGWTVGIDTPEDGNETPGASLSGVWQSDGGCWGVVTSGNYRKFYVRDGRKYAHTIDPRSGWPVQHSLLSATVTKDGSAEERSAAVSDAFATWFMVVGAEEALKYCGNGVEALLITSEGPVRSPGFSLR